MTRTIQLLAFMVVIAVFASCNDESKTQPTGKSDTTYVMQDVDIPFPDTSALTGKDSLPFNAQNVKGYAAKYWGKVLKNCMSSVFIGPKDADYLGIGNTLGLGTITDANRDNIFDRIDNNGFTPEELTFMIDSGKYSGCSYVISGKLDLTAMAGGDIDINSTNDDLNAQVQAAIKNSKDINFSVTSFRKQSLFMERVMQTLDNSPNNRKTSLKALILDPKNELMKTAIVIKGFTAEVKLQKDISPSVSASMKGDSTTAKIGNLTANAKLSIVNSKTLKISSDDEFIIFGKFGKVVARQ